MEKRLTVALLSGGTSPEREVSLASGSQVYDALDKNRYFVRRYDPKTDIARLVADAPQIDVALVILHGVGGEDGSIQGLLDLLHIPYQCAGLLGSSVAMNKLAAKQLYIQNQVPTPAFFPVRRKDVFDTDAGIHRLGLPLVVKPASGGSSIGMSIVRTTDEMPRALAAAFAVDGTALLEEYIKGIEITVAVLGNEHPEALPVVEIVPNDTHGFFDFAAKYTAGETLEICPARISEDLARIARDLAIKAHVALFCKGYSRTDMMVRGQDIFVLETNTIPGMTSQSLLPLAARAAGMDFAGLIDRLIALALEKPKILREKTDEVFKKRKTP